MDYRDPRVARKIRDEIRSLRGEIGENLIFMHVCGTHQDTLVRFGLDDVLMGIGIDVREGPGCPVCVTTTREIEMAKHLARRGATIAVYGDMLRAPGADGSLQDVRAEGGDVRVVYSAIDALRMARENPDRDVVFFGVGFETTAPATAAVLLSDPPDNFSVLCIHRYTPPAVRGVAELGRVMLNGMVLPGHVSTITGIGPWLFVAEEYRMPAVIAGFEPLDLLMGILMLMRQVRDGRAEVEIEYSRVVRPEGNVKAQEAMREVFEPKDVEWRGFPVIPGSGMGIRRAFEDHDAEKRYEDYLAELEGKEFPDPPGCRCGEVIRGEMHSWECPLFGKVCTPESPVGPCMVSVEGACAIEYKYGRWKRRAARRD